jgi:hypothetical protein
MMACKSASETLAPDVRFSDLCVVENGVARLMDLSDHHAGIASVNLTGTAPQEVRDAFDCARSALVYAYFNYDLLVVGEIQLRHYG